jgi:hypothetical protein
VGVVNWLLLTIIVVPCVFIVLVMLLVCAIVIAEDRHEEL